MKQHDLANVLIKLFGLFVALWVLIRLPGQLISSVSWALRAQHTETISFAWTHSIADLIGVLIQVIAGIILIRYSRKLTDLLLREQGTQ
jgi:hypothetical protein